MPLACSACIVMPHRSQQGSGVAVLRLAAGLIMGAYNHESKLGCGCL